MGFSFRRSTSFGPFRLNVSKSGIGASVGVNGARVTRTARGRTYITVGAGGFAYRQNLSPVPRASASPHPTSVPTTPATDTIQTADVEELRESSKSELVGQLNRRAQMFNPAILFFILAAIGALLGFINLGNLLSPALPVLPDVASDSSSSRQSNSADEYALLVARYGQPATVHLSRMGSVPLRDATWDAAQLTVRFVPTGCVDAYTYVESHKNDPAPVHVSGRHRGIAPVDAPAVPTCNAGAQASTIVAYEDIPSHTSVDAPRATATLATVTTRSTSQPSITVDQPGVAKGHSAKVSPLPPTVSYDMPTFEREQQQLRDAEAEGKDTTRRGVLFLLGTVLILIPGVLVHRKNKEQRTTELIYDLSGPAKAQHEELEGALGQLGRSSAIWRLDSQSVVTDWKRNAGAAYNVQRERVAMRRTAPARVETNLEPMCLDLGKLKLFFLPDQILYWQRGTFASIEYGDLKVTSTSTRFIEESVQTSDSQQVGSTWRYVRKDGGPDRRFNNNRQLPIMLYGVVHATSLGGLNLVFHISRSDAATAFHSMFLAFQTNRVRADLPPKATDVPKGSANSGMPSGSTYPAHIVEAMSVLGVKPGASVAEVAAAYRHMAQMYHPDKTSGLGQELQELADKRMKEINAAHQTMKQYMERA